MKYIADFDSKFNKGISYAYSLSGSTKITYIAKTLNSITEKDSHVEIISTSLPLSNSGIVRGKEYDYNEGVSVKLFGSFGCKNKILKGIRYYLLLFKLFIYLLFHVKKRETIIVYHELKYINCFSLLKKLKKFKLILEVEEIYGDVKNCKKTINKELDFFKKADAYIFPTELLNSKINVKNKPYAINHGTYNVEKQIANKFDDGKIHCVYAGTFDVRKGGALFAIKSAKFLSEKYHLHVLGFGNNDDTNLVKKTIEEVNSLGKCTVTFDGLKSGEEYIKFIQSCHIGLSTQNPNAKFNDTSFPSKVLSYMANGLRVVSIKIKALETSAVNELLYYYNEDNPEEIAKAIQSVNVLDNYDSRAKISELDEQFNQDIKKLLRG